MKTTITGFHQDEESNWVAELACGHSRHFRHNPPPLKEEAPRPPSEKGEENTPQGREQFLGSELDCIECDQDCQ